MAAISSTGGCKGGVGSIIAGDIQGPGWLDENLAADYSIEATDVVNPAYSWSVDPQSAGAFTNADRAMSTFHANEVTVNTTTKISVTITGYNANPLTVRKDVTVMDTNQAPVAAAQADKTRIGAGQQVQFRECIARIEDVFRL